MSIEFIGIAATAPHSETEIATEPTDPVQPGYLEELARAHEEAGFDRVAIHHITGGDELDQKRDGDFADHDRRYARTAAGARSA